MNTLPSTRRDGAPADARPTPAASAAVDVEAPPALAHKKSTSRRGSRGSAKQTDGMAPVNGNVRSLNIEDFLDLAAHELRAPLTILKGQAQLLHMRLLKSEAGSDRARDAADLDKMLFQIERLNHQVSVLLDATHLTQRRFGVAPLHFDMAQIVQRLVVVFDAGSPALTIEYVAPPQEASFIGTGDRQHVETALREFLFNAVRYGGQHCTVRLTREGDASQPQARLEVEDSGIGVPARERSAIFREWTHGSNAERPGLGLGLYVTREIVRRHHGRIGVRPRSPRGQRGQHAAPGSVFWLTLPLEPDEAAGASTGV